MKGLLLGLTYSSMAFFILVHFGLRYAYRNLNTRDISCGTWYFVVSCALTGVLIVLSVLYLIGTLREGAETMLIMLLLKAVICHYTASQNEPINNM